MYLVESKAGAIACMLLSLFFLGTWPAMFTFLERKGRLPQHTYLDYTITNLLAALFFAFTFGEIGTSTAKEPNFLEQLSQDNWPSVLFAVAGGIGLSLGNLATQYSLAFVGLSVTEVITGSMIVVLGLLHFIPTTLMDLAVVLQCSCICLSALRVRTNLSGVIFNVRKFIPSGFSTFFKLPIPLAGTTVNYFLDDKINEAGILFPGVGCFLIAVLLGSAVHASNVADNRMKMDLSSYEKIDSGFCNHSGLQPVPENADVEHASEPKTAEAGSGDFLLELENRRAIKILGKSPLSGLGITFFAGLSFSIFSPAFNLATNDQWHTLKEGVPHLTVYTAFFYFSVSCFVIATVLNITFLYHPILNLPRSSFKAYLHDWNGRAWALFAGFLCGLGNGLQFMGGEAAGYATADAVQALPLVSTFWGIVLLKEYRKASRRTYVLLVSMLFMFIVAVALLMASAGQRTESAAA